MNNDPAPTIKTLTSKLESYSFYVFLVTLVLAPIVFWANPFISTDLVKTFVIAIGMIATALLIGLVAIKERQIFLPPKVLWRSSLLLIASIVISSLQSFHIEKSFFGQGFEIGSASFIILLFLSAILAYTVISRQKDRSVVVYVGIVVTYIILYIVHLLRIIFGPSFMTLGIMNSTTSTILGTWYNLGTFSAVIFIFALLSLMLLRLSFRMKIVYWILLVISLFGIIVVADTRVWFILSLVFLGLSICLSIEKWRLIRKDSTNWFRSIIKSLSWVPIVAFLVLTLLFWSGGSIVRPIITKLNVAYTELYLPWQMTLGVTASVVQNSPLFGIGSNNFSQAYLAFKPAGINETNVWSAEFLSGFGYIPTFVVSHGVIGSILWLIFFVFFGIISTKILRNIPNDLEKRFLLLSSFLAALFLWLIAAISVPSHAILFLTFVLSGTFIGLATAYGLIENRVIAPPVGTKLYKVFSSILSIVILILVVWGLVYIKKTIALAYFGDGVKILNTSSDVEKADRAFTKALKMDNSDTYWRAKAETAIIASQKLASTVTPNSSASSTQAVLTQINNILNQGLIDARKAIQFDRSNYYNYLSEARVSEIATGLKMQNGYENAVASYQRAIGLNPSNPFIYLSLANLQASQAKYDDALQSLGNALRVKNNYLDAIFLLSQIYATKGDIANATIAAKVAVQLDPQNPVLLFQLGILSYNAKDYNGAIQAFAEAIKYQPDYANARYFLGLSYARLNNTAKAIEMFEGLAVTNPENQEIALLLANLRNGRSIFTDAKPSVTTNPEKRSSLPIKEKK